MRPRFYFVMAATILFSMCPFRSWGQDQTPPPLLFGGFDTQGTVSVGYRFTTVKGQMDTYNDMFDLHKGFRLMDVNLTGLAPEGSNLFADHYSLTASGLGGDPYEVGQLKVSKDKLYDLTVTYRQSYYYWSENNGTPPLWNASQVMVLPTPSGYTNGITANHNWAFDRRVGIVDLKIRATNHLQFSFDYTRNSRDGMNQTTRSLGFNNDPSIWGSFSRANPYIFEGPLADLSNRITGGISYALRSWTFHYRVGYQSSSSNSNLTPLMTPEISINTSPAVHATPPTNIGSITAQERLNGGSWSEYRRLTTPISEFSYDGKVNNWLELRGGYNYYNFKGPDTVDGSFIGIARIVSSPTSPAASNYQPYSLSINSRASLTMPSHEANQGLTAKIADWMSFFADYRYTRSIETGLNNYGSVFTQGTIPTGTGTPGIPVNCPAPYQLRTCNDWTVGTHLVNLNLEFTPTPSLVIRAGIRYIKRDVEDFTDGALNTLKENNAVNIQTLQTKSVWPTVSVFYKPVKIFSVRADFQSDTSSDPYTNISAHTDLGTRFVVRLQPTDKLSIEDNLMIRDRTFLQTAFHNRYRTNAINASYDFSNRFSAEAGYSYESIYAEDAAIYPASATAPFTGFQEDSFINRGVRGGLIIKPAKGFGISFSGNFLRTTGASRLFSTSALVGTTPGVTFPIVWPVDIGPITWPLATATVYYDFPKAGRLSLDFERTYYVQQLVSGNNFQADLLTLKWTTNVRRAGQ